MSDKNLQGIFDVVAAHLLRQDERSEDVEGCAYRGQRGLRCAVGCLISDEAYSADLETGGVTEERVQAALTRSGVLLHGRALDLLEDLQMIHDIVDPDCWPHRLRELALRYEFTVPVGL